MQENTSENTPKIIDMAETEKELTLEFATKLLFIDLEIIALEAEKKMLRADAKERGVLIKNVLRIIRKMKKELKKGAETTNTDDERVENMLSESETIKDMLFKIVNKE